MLSQWSLRLSSSFFFLILFSMLPIWEAFMTVGVLLWHCCSPVRVSPSWWMWDLISAWWHPSYRLVAASLSLSVGFIFLVSPSILLLMAVQQLVATSALLQQDMSTHPSTLPSWTNLSWPAFCGLWFQYLFCLQTFCSVIQIYSVWVSPRGQLGTWVANYPQSSVLKVVGLLLELNPHMCSLETEPICLSTAISWDPFLNLAPLQCLQTLCQDPFSCPLAGNPGLSSL